MLRLRTTRKQRAHWKWQDKQPLPPNYETEPADISKLPPDQRAALVRLASKVGLAHKDLTTDLKLEHVGERVMDIFTNYWPAYRDWVAWESFLEELHRREVGRKARCA